MEVMCLSDKNEFPDDRVLARHLGQRKELWDVFMQFLTGYDPDLLPEWRYYTDGKSWLCKVTRKKKTLCWVSVYPELFKVAFCFTDKARDLLLESGLSPEHRDRFLNGKYCGKLKSIVVEMTGSQALDQVRILLDVKKKLK